MNKETLSIAKKIAHIEDIGVDLIDKNFPKHRCKERGAAIVLYAELIIALRKEFGVEV